MNSGPALCLGGYKSQLLGSCSIISTERPQLATWSWVASSSWPVSSPSTQGSRQWVSLVPPLRTRESERGKSSTPVQSKEGVERGWVNMENSPHEETPRHTLIFPTSPHASIPLCLPTSSLPFSRVQSLHLHCPHLLLCLCSISVWVCSQYLYPLLSICFYLQTNTFLHCWETCFWTHLCFLSFLTVTNHTWALLILLQPPSPLQSPPTSSLQQLSPDFTLPKHQYLPGWQSNNFFQ